VLFGVGFLYLYSLSGSVLTWGTGLITAGICNLCIAASLAEFLSAYPTLVFLTLKFGIRGVDGI
jgi:hypothetical protein